MIQLSRNNIGKLHLKGDQAFASQAHVVSVKPE